VKILFASQNQHKLEEVSNLLPKNIELIGLSDLHFSREILETEASIEGNALLKARVIYKEFGIPCFADDTGLFIDALNGQPGVHSARWHDEDDRFETNLEKALFELKNKENRKAHFKTVIAFIDNNKERLFEGRIDGEIIQTLRGNSGFGYDPIFIPVGYDQTFAEMPATLKNKISHRGIAVQHLIEFLS
jgi:XTP/dITP diphosphohydrolase